MKRKQQKEEVSITICPLFKRPEKKRTKLSEETKARAGPDLYSMVHQPMLLLHFALSRWELAKNMSLEGGMSLRREEIESPAYWGLMNPQWNMCSKGRRQSPINIEPDKLLFDPYLRHIHLDKHKVSGMLHNTGQSLVFRVDKDTKQHVNISGGTISVSIPIRGDLHSLRIRKSTRIRTSHPRLLVPSGAQERLIGRFLTEGVLGGYTAA
ncbi:hypothetical protein NQ315_017190 [Exocentrus adspersus]|uniref:Alpha-carbonic anhydrase domain-containing protein n=1 Tax=Exocentrus adspersus TaxID=1586481 RepID=A0AAV8VHT5_9CUCU|nr:hypothetical protein NQ315_017190 [Exocentrus adspersus]